MTDCIFCKIVKGKIPSAKIYENSDMIAFLDINPVNKGHVLLIPKKHHHWMTDVPDDLLAKLFIKTKHLMRAIKESTKADFIVLTIVGIDVPHFHIHLIPRYYNDGLENFWPTKKYDENEMSKVTKKIKQYL